MFVETFHVDQGSSLVENIQEKITHECSFSRDKHYWCSLESCIVLWVEIEIKTKLILYPQHSFILPFHFIARAYNIFEESMTLLAQTLVIFWYLLCYSILYIGILYIIKIASYSKPSFIFIWFNQSCKGYSSYFLLQHHLCVEILRGHWFLHC